MSLYNSYDRTSFLGELNSPLDTQLGVLTPAQQRERVQANIFGTGTVLTDGIFGGIGNSSTPADMGTATGFGLDYRMKSEATGSIRGEYVYLELDGGVAQQGEAIRAFTRVNGVPVASGGTVNGAHISMYIDGAAGAISGAGNALRATLGVGPSVTAPGGTNSVIQVDTDIDTTDTVPANWSYIRFTDSNVKTISKLVTLPVDVASGALLAAHITDAMTHSIRIQSKSGTVYYLMATTTITNRTGGA